MTYTDEQLSAFLDGELSPVEMEAIRNALANNETLADRLAELSAVDSSIRAVYDTINDRPIPPEVTALLEAPTADTGTVVSLPPLDRLKQAAGRHLALAASVILAVGIAFGVLLNSGPQRDSREAIASVLDTRPSGTRQQLDGEVSVTPRLTFRDKAGNYCRLFELSDATGTRQSLACREAGEWQIAATVYSDPETGDLYQPAGGGSPLDTLIDRRIAEGPFDRTEETALIGNAWEGLK